MSAPDKNTALHGVMLGIMAFAVFSSHDAVIKFIGRDFSAVQVIFFSVLFGFPPVAMAMSADRALDNFRPQHPWYLLLRTVMMVMSMMCIFYSFSTLPLTQVYAIIFMSPLLITVLSVPLLGEVVRLRRWIAIFVGLAGVLVVLRPGLTPMTLGHLTALAAAVLNAVGSIVIRKISADERSAVLILFPMFANLAVAGALLPFVYKPMAIGDLGLTAAIGLLAFVGQALLIAAFKRASPTLIAPMQYSQIIWATLFGLLFFNETPDMWVAVGTAIIVSSGIYIVWRESRTSVSGNQPVLNTQNMRQDTGPSTDPKGKRRMGMGIRIRFSD